MFVVLLGFTPAILFTIVLFLINPILGVLGIIWFIWLGVRTWKKK